MLPTKFQFIWPRGFRGECEKLTDDGRQVMAKAHVAFSKVSLKSFLFIFPKGLILKMHFLEWNINYSKYIKNVP
jgi:hypothetical protein